MAIVGEQGKGHRTVLVIAVLVGAVLLGRWLFAVRWREDAN
jgi:hypothetical protein